MSNTNRIVHQYMYTLHNCHVFCGTTLQEKLSSPRISGVRVARSLVFYAVFCRSLLVHFLLAIVFFLDLWILLTPLISLNSSYRNRHIYILRMKHDFYISFQNEHMTWYNCKSLDCPAGCYADNKNFKHSDDLTVACYRKLFCTSLSITAKPVVRGHHWDKEKLAS